MFILGQIILKFSFILKSYWFGYFKNYFFMLSFTFFLKLLKCTCVSCRVLWWNTLSLIKKVIIYRWLQCLVWNFSLKLLLRILRRWSIMAFSFLIHRSVLNWIRTQNRYCFRAIWSWFIWFILFIQWTKISSASRSDITLNSLKCEIIRVQTLCRLEGLQVRFGFILL